MIILNKENKILTSIDLEMLRLDLRMDLKVWLWEWDQAW